MSRSPKILRNIIETDHKLADLIARVRLNRQAAYNCFSKILLTEQQVAVLLGMSPSHLRENRYKGKPPAYYKLGSNVRYDFFALIDHLQPTMPKEVAL